MYGLQCRIAAHWSTARTASGAEAPGAVGATSSCASPLLPLAQPAKEALAGYTARWQKARKGDHETRSRRVIAATKPARQTVPLEQITITWHRQPFWNGESGKIPCVIAGKQLGVLLEWLRHTHHPTEKGAPDLLRWFG